jgi:serine protease
MKALTLNLKLLISISISCLCACIDTGQSHNAPKTDISITYPQNLSALFKVDFLDTTPKSIQWDFGDGYSGSGSVINHQYLSAGNYSGKLSYNENGEDIHHNLTINIEGSNQSVTVKPTINIIIDSDHNDPNQLYKDNNLVPQLINSPLILSGILLQPNTCQAGRLCDTGDVLDWYTANLDYGDMIDIEVIKGSIDLQLIASDGEIIANNKNITNDLNIPAGQISTGQYQLYIKLNPLSDKSQYINHVQQQTVEQPTNYQPGKLIIQWEGTDNPELVDIKDSRIFNITDPNQTSSLPNARNSLMKNTDIKSVSLNYYRQPFSLENWQWPLIQQEITTLWEPLLIQGELPGQNTTVAILDTGIFFQHSNLIGMQTHSGYDFVSDPVNSGDYNGWDHDPSDPGNDNLNYHGSHVTGIIAAQPSDLGTSITGLAWAASIMPLRVLGQNGGTSYDLIQALRYAAGLSNDSQQLPSKPADIINLSLGGSEFSVAEQATINQVTKSGVIIVAATGNQGQNKISYPAAYKDVIAVGATDINGNIAEYSNYGAFIDIVAPGGHCTDNLCTEGVNSLSAIGMIQGQFDSRQSSWKRLSGTSMATAHVTGLLAIARSKLPSLDSNAINQLIKQQKITSDLLTAGFDYKSGWGNINSTKLLDLINTSHLDQASIWTSQSEVYLNPDETLSLPIITRGDTSKKTISAKYNPESLTISTNMNTLTISTPSDFTNNQTIELYLEDTLTSTINLYPKKNYPLPEFSQHLYLDLKNKGISSSGLRTVIEQDSWYANIPTLSPGQSIQASSDIDYDGVYCEIGEFCAQSEVGDSGSNNLILNGSILKR